MSKKAAKAIAKDLDREAIANVSSDLLEDAIYSFATDLLKGLWEDGNLQDLGRAIATVNATTRGIASNGVNLRKANIERRKRDKKDVDDEPIDKESVKWRKYRKGSGLEYTTDFAINGKYPLKKRGEDVVVGLLEEDQLDGKGRGNKLSSKEKEAIFAAGFVPE